MTLLLETTIEETRNQLEEMIKPFQQEQNQRQKKSDFLQKCIQCIDKNDFFQLDELLKTKEVQELSEDPNFQGCESIFSQISSYANQQIENYRLQFKDGLLEAAEKVGLPIEFDASRFIVLKGIEGTVDFSKRTTTINQTILKSIDPKRIVSTALNIKRKLYDSPFEAQKFIDSLFECYTETLQKLNLGIGEPVSVSQLYIDYVMSIQNKNFFQNMDKGKFKGYSVDQFAVDLWRYFESNASSTEGGYRLKFNSGRGKILWLIDQNGEKRQISNVSFTKN